MNEQLRLDFIEYGSTEGPYFTEWRFTELSRLAEELLEVIPAATGWKIWYDWYHDYHHLEFDLEGRHYVVQYYKIFTIHFDNNTDYGSEFPRKNYGRYSYNIVKLFRSGRYRTWENQGE